MKDKKFYLQLVGFKHDVHTDLNPEASRWIHSHFKMHTVAHPFKEVGTQYFLQPFVNRDDLE